MEKLKLYPGERFVFNNIEFVCLECTENEMFAMTTEFWKNLPFDENNNNNWKDSSLRRALNEDFLPKIEEKVLVKTAQDLTADNGDRSYGVCTDYITILTVDQFRKYRDILLPIVKEFDDWMWTLTPWACKSPNASYGNHVRFVTPTGIININNAYYSYGVAPACTFNLSHLKSRRQARVLVEADESDN